MRRAGRGVKRRHDASGGGGGGGGGGGARARGGGGGDGFPAGAARTANVAQRRAAIAQALSGAVRAEDDEDIDSDDFSDGGSGGGDSDINVESDDEGGGRGGGSDGDYASDDEGGGAAAALAKESAQEKRLRLARQYLNVLGDDSGSDEDDRSSGGSGDEGDSGGDGDGDGDAVAAKLTEAHLRSIGKLYEPVADTVEIRAGAAERAGRHNVHRLAPTCVALSPGDATVWSGSKDCSLVMWDVESSVTRYVLPPWRESDDWRSGEREVLSVACSDDGKLVAAGGRDRVVRVWDVRSRGDFSKPVRSVTMDMVLDQSGQENVGHRDAVTALAFRASSRTLYSGSDDRCIKHWDLDGGGYVETLYGHQSGVTGLSCGAGERPVSSGRDRTARLWKVREETQLLFRGPVGCSGLDCVASLSDDWFVTGGDDNGLALWHTGSKKPRSLVSDAHGPGTDRWVTAVAALRGTDCVVSGSSDGAVRVWKADREARKLTPAGRFDGLPGFVNGLAVASGRFVAAAVGHEHRLGRWWRDAKAENAVVLLPLGIGGGGGADADDSSDDEE